MALFIRRESPPTFSDHREYLPFLRRDFLYRGAYCERSEAFLGGQDFFEIDHFRPESKFPTLRSHYPNLYYCCGKCNRYKGSTWPANHLWELGFRFADPCLEDMYKDHFQQGQDCRLQSLTPCGDYTERHIRLNRPDLLTWRQQRLKAEADLGEFAALREQLEALLPMVMEPSEREDLQNRLDSVDSFMADTQRRFNL